MLLLLSGCSSIPASINPVTWWHDLQGGKIAEDRPPPPGADQPYPNLASVPPKPAQPDRAALTNIANALIADRTNAQHVAAAAPIADPSLPSASPGLFGRGTVGPPPPPGAQTASATLPAAEAPPPPPAPRGNAAGAAPSPATAPVGTVESAPLAPPGATAQPPAAAAGPPPPLPNAPPPPPNLPGVAASPRPPPAPTTAVAAATPATPPPTASADSVNVIFITGSSSLPPSGADTLKQLAARRGNGVIAVTGYGDAASDDPAAQSAALALGLSRAKAMAAALTSAGVPSSAVEVDAAAVGRGGTARLIR